MALLWKKKIRKMCTLGAIYDSNENYFAIIVRALSESKIVPELLIFDILPDSIDRETLYM